ncbi:hypothetical protein KY285_013474 [Solanum tuberosum]|nr:hypothetical protein KY285_013474 [Solanum tuberosum]
MPQVNWIEQEVIKMTCIKKFQFVVIGKFSYEWTDLDELRRIIPQQCELKGDCVIGLLCIFYLDLTKQEDYVNMISKGPFYINCRDGYSYLMHTLIYDSRFKVSEETTMTMAWISFPNLFPTFFVKEVLLSIASAVGKSIDLDQATIKKTRPSCARVKVLVDLKGKFPNSVQMNIENSETGEIRSNIIKIQYDYVPKYCLECKMQGHNKNNCKAGEMARRKEEPTKQGSKINVNKSNILYYKNGMLEYLQVEKLLKIQITGM